MISKVRIGDVIIGEINDSEVPGGYMAYRVAAGQPGRVQVGSAETQRGALTLIAQSLIARSIDDSLSPRQRERLRDAYRILVDAGLANVATMISEVLK